MKPKTAGKYKDGLCEAIANSYQNNPKGAAKLLFFAGYSNQEIADAVNYSKSWVQKYKVTTGTAMYDSRKQVLFVGALIGLWHALDFEKYHPGEELTEEWINRWATQNNLDNLREDRNKKQK